MKINKFLGFILALLVLLIIVMAMGPKMSFEETDNKSLNKNYTINEAIDRVAEHKVANIRTGCEDGIVWAGAEGEKTAYTILYLHGFSACHQEGSPAHKAIAQRYGMNLYLSRLSEHGVESEESMKELTPASLLHSAKEAMEIAKALGDSVIVMSCSTGSTLAAILDPNEPKIAAHIMYAPNIDIYDPMSRFVTWPWGKQIMKLVLGSDQNHIEYNTEQGKYWYADYHNNSIIALKTLLNNWMNEDLFKQIDTPIFIGYYYKNEEEQDKIVSIDRMLDFFSQVSTPEKYKHKVAYPDAGAHVICSDLFSKSYKQVILDTEDYLDNIMGLKPTTLKENLNVQISE